MKVWIVNVESENCDKKTHVFKHNPSDKELEDLIYTVWGGTPDSWTEVFKSEEMKEEFRRGDNWAAIDGIGSCDILVEII